MTLKMLGCECNCQKPCPIVRKCCFCVPIRRGVIIFSYVNLVASLLSLPILIFLLVDHLSSDAPSADDVKDPTVHLPLTITFMSTDVIMTIVLLVGAHKRKKILLQVYLYFGVGLQVVTCCVNLAYFDHRQYVEYSVYLIFLGLNIYLVFLVYSTIRVLEENKICGVSEQSAEMNLILLKA